MIKDKALELRSSNDFIASKGWLDKFKIRYRLEITKEANSAGIINPSMLNNQMGSSSLVIANSSNNT